MPFDFPNSPNVNDTATGVAGEVYKWDGVKWATTTVAAAGVTSFNSRVGAVMPAAGDYTAAMVTNAVSTQGSYASPSWLTQINWNIVTGAPSFLVSPLTTKGDLLGFSTANARLPVGTDGQVLTADSTQALGIKWATGAAGGGYWSPGTAGIYYASGPVGIGSSSPVNPGSTYGALTLNGSAGGLVYFQNAGTTYGVVYTDGTKFDVSNNNSGVPITFDTAGAERMRISTAGNVGIGTNSPAVLLDLKGNNVAYGGQLRIQSADYAQITFYSSANPALGSANELGAVYFDVVGGNLEIANFKSGSLTFATNNFAQMTIASSGNVGIGTSSPASTLDVNGMIRSIGAFTPTSGAGVEVQYTGGNGYVIAYDRTASAYHQLVIGGAGVIVDGHGTAIQLNPTSGNVGIGTSSPAVRCEVVSGADLGGPTLGTAGGVLALHGSSQTWGLYFGTVSSGLCWLQVQRSDASTTTYPLSLNPSGGAVMFGTGSGITGGGNFQVAGDCNISGTYRVNGTAISSYGGPTSMNNVTASRALGTTYTNSTGKPMWVSVGIAFNANNQVSAVVSGTTVAQFQTPTSSGLYMSLFFVVTNGQTYAVNIGSGAAPNPSILEWIEWS